ncbi:MAG: hypothetical protein NT145_01110 [Elusimicrobia bacterium]|nr:hypothetical protein [Elusimicrobiota bacterium]
MLLIFSCMVFLSSWAKAERNNLVFWSSLNSIDMKGMNTMIDVFADSWKGYNAVEYFRSIKKITSATSLGIEGTYDINNKYAVGGRIGLIVAGPGEVIYEGDTYTQSTVGADTYTYSRNERKNRKFYATLLPIRSNQL